MSVQRQHIALGISLAAVAVVVAAVLYGGGRTLFGPAPAGLTADTVAGFCTDCHNGADFQANLALDRPELADIGAHAETWEKVVHKLLARTSAHAAWGCVLRSRCHAPRRSH
jgi:hypothetical protein